MHVQFSNLRCTILGCGLCVILLLRVGSEARSIEAVEAIPLTGVWKFRPDPEGIGEDEKWYSTELDDPAWEDINVPGTWNEVESGRTMEITVKVNGEEL